MTGPRVMFIGEKDGYADVRVLDDVRGVLGCTPGDLIWTGGGGSVGPL